MGELDLPLSFLLTLALHASVLLGATWLAERAGWLRHLGWAELAWRTALFGALLSATLATALPALERATVSHRQATDTGTATPQARQDAMAPARSPDPDKAFMTPAPRRDASQALNAALNLPAPAMLAASPEADGDTALSDGVPSQDARIALPDVIALALLALWTLGLIVGLVRLGRQALALHRLGCAATRSGKPADESLVRHARRLAAELGIAPPTLRVSPYAVSPLVLPGARVLLPDWAASLDARQQRALLAHELSHLQRRDPAWRIAQRLALLPLFFHPLAWHARHRLEALAEDACDARAAQLLGSGRPLAECLATCLSHAGARAGNPALAVAMASDSGHVLRRVKNLLEESPMSLRPLSPTLRRTALIAALVALVALPGLAVTTFAAEGLGDGVRRMIVGGNNYSYRQSSGNHRLDVKQVGSVDFNDAGTDVTRLGKGAKFEIVETRDGVKREIHIYGKDGAIQRDYRMDGSPQPLDAGRAWLAQRLPEVLRETGINADSRGKALLAKGGPDALLAEIALIKADHSAARYVAVLFNNAALDAAQMDRVMKLMQDITSDFEMRQALQAALDSQDLPPTQQVQLLELSMQISSDFEQAELLSSLAETLPPDGDVLRAWRKALAGISSDFEQRRVLDALLTRGQPSAAQVVMALDAAHGISSDFETRAVLASAAPRLGASPEARAAYFRLARTIGSDFELREALNQLLRAGPVDAATADGVLTLLSDIGSDFEAGEVLKSLAGVMPADPALIERYRAAARRLGDFERGQAEKALDRFAAAG
ncbi:MAG: hypothetical protein K0M70_08400 [Arenimonas sp.]|uniref:M56 family metallopeptidase n=1 Tax=Arenimonas sp. TaxID=1872635 RepID=UPI0025BEDC68|nr:M56 family metallopeptidase [Arenimonas sp.]MBW8367863.1 hypothetical protein [Arenimonas sp.]